MNHPEKGVVDQLPTTNDIHQLFRPIILFPNNRLPKFLLCPRTKITFPTLFFLGILKSCQDRPNHTSTLGWKRVPCLYSACTHVHRTYTDLSGHTLRMGKADDRERSKLKSLPSISLRALRHSPFNLLLLRSELFLTISVPLSTNSTHSVEHCFLKKVEQNKAFFLLIS